MLKKTIKYTDYNGKEREEDFYFNLSRAEIIELEYGTKGHLTNVIQEIIDTDNEPELVKIFKDLVLKAYGVKSEDGKRFIKNDEVRTAFAQTEAYSVLFTTLATDADEAAKFVNGIIPQDTSAPAAPSVNK